MNNKVRQVTGGLIWTYAERMLAQSVTIIVTIILARLIAPEEYGIVSIVNVFINIANSFVMGGFGNSLIQKKDADEVDFSTVFYFSLVFSCGIYFVLFCFAGTIAEFYNISELKLIIRVMALRLPIAAINSIQQAYISKQMRFKKFFFATLGGTVFSAIVGISMAYTGFGIWAVVAQYLTNVCIDTIVLWFLSGWKPKFVYSAKRMRTLFSYGWKIMCVSVMTTLYTNLRNLVIGKKYTSEDLAFSEKGEQFPSAIAGNINSSITKVLFPVLSEYQHDNEQLLRMVRRSIKVGTYILFPIMFGFAVVSRPFVSSFMTDKWIGCVPFLQIMCVLYALQPLQTASLQCIKAKGKSKLYLWVDILKKIVGIFILIVTIAVVDNVIVIVWGALIVEIFSVVILFPINKRLIEYRYRDQILDILPNIGITTVMCCLILVMNALISFTALAQLMLDVVVGIIIFVGISAISKNENFIYVIKIIKSLIKRS